MNKEMQKVCDEKAESFGHVINGNITHGEAYHSFRCGFEAAVRSEQVQGLIEALKKIEADDDAASYFAKLALQKFRGDSEV